MVARFHRARTRHHNHLFASDFQTVGKLDYGSLWPEASSRQLVGCTDPMNVFDSGEHFEVANIKIDSRPDRSHHGLPRSGGAMYREAHRNEVFHHMLDLLLGCRFLHGDDHRKSLVDGRWSLVLVFANDERPTTVQSFTSASNSVSPGTSVARALGAISSC